MSSIIIVARCSGERIDPTVLIEHYGLEASRVWRRGEAGRRGVVNADSGLNIPVAAVPSDQAADAALAWIQAHGALIAEISAAGGSTELDFAVFVPALGSRSFHLAARVLADLGAVAVSVTVSAYPVSDESAT